jgi:hypothetical protein
MNKRMQQNSKGGGTIGECQLAIDNCKIENRKSKIENVKTVPTHESTRIFCVYALLACASLTAGCSRSEFGSQRSAFVRTQHAARSTQHVMAVAQDVLAEMYFEIEKADVDAGLIRTKPLPGAQFFEFWRSDNVGAENTFMANLHTIRRTVTLYISRQDNELRIDCEVHAQRLSLPERQVGSSARVYGMFSRSSPSLQRLELNPEQKAEMAWIDLAPDSKLEAEILKRIETQILQRTNQRLQTMENQT